MVRPNHRGLTDGSHDVQSHTELGLEFYCLKDNVALTIVAASLEAVRFITFSVSETA